MPGARFLDADFIALKLPFSLSSENWGSASGPRCGMADVGGGAGVAVVGRAPQGGTFRFQIFINGNLGGNAQRTRHALNADTIREMHLAFRRGGRKAIEKVMRNQPAV